MIYRHCRAYLLVLALVWLSSCASYKQNILFTAESAKIIEQSRNQLSNYKIAPDDYLTVDVYTKNGERIIDPDFELNQQNRGQQNVKVEYTYLVRTDGNVKLPMVGDANLKGLTLWEAESQLQQSYEKYYKNSYVTISFVNKRVTVLGAMGGQVIPLENENIYVTEILALSGGLDVNAKGHNIKVLRGDEIFELDFSTFENYQSSKMIVHSGDIIYVEPVRRPFSEFVKENGPIITIFSSIISLAVLIISIR